MTGIQVFVAHETLSIGRVIELTIDIQLQRGSLDGVTVDYIHWQQIRTRLVYNETMSKGVVYQPESREPSCFANLGNARNHANKRNARWNYFCLGEHLFVTDKSNKKSGRSSKLIANKRSELFTDFCSALFLDELTAAVQCSSTVEHLVAVRHLHCGECDTTELHCWK